MKIKKYTGEDKKEILDKVKMDLGSDALILSIKEIKPKGLFKLFKKIQLEVTAAADDKEITHNQIENMKSQLSNDINNKFDNIQKLLHQTIEKQNISTEREDNEKPSILNHFYKHLKTSGVSENVAIKLLGNITTQNINEVVEILYERIIKLIGKPQEINCEINVPKTIFFVGTTGVGKTTTLAKIATEYKLNRNKKIGFITCDTYRIAAVEQLKVYAKLLDIPLKVVYTAEEFDDALAGYSEMDLIFVDTAGRSHKDTKHIDDLKDLLNKVSEKEVYLVLSLTSKYSDIKEIIQRYDDVEDMKIIFTKYDETDTFGNIVNACEDYHYSLSYITFGQNVPDDFEIIQPEKIARAILGGK